MSPKVTKNILLTSLLYLIWCGVFCVCVASEVKYMLMCLLAIWIFSVQVKAHFCIVCPFLIDLHDSLHNLSPGFWLLFCITDIFPHTVGCSCTPKLVSFGTRFFSLTVQSVSCLLYTVKCLVCFV